VVIRGDIFLADLGDPIGHEQAFRRPVAVVSGQRWLDTDPPVVVTLAITRTQRNWPEHVELDPGSSGLRDVSYLTCEFVRAVSPLRFVRRLGHVDAVVMAKVDGILKRLLFA
jgi:mRNA interferase MazF